MSRKEAIFTWLAILGLIAIVGIQALTINHLTNTVHQLDRRTAVNGIVPTE